MEWLCQSINPAERGLFHRSDSSGRADLQRRYLRLWMFLEAQATKKIVDVYRWDVKDRKRKVKEIGGRAESVW